MDQRPCRQVIHTGVVLPITHYFGNWSHRVFPEGFAVVGFEQRFDATVQQSNDGKIQVPANSRPKP